MTLLVFLDESGDHSLEKIDPTYPVFALAGVLIEPGKYPEIVNKFNRLKLTYFPHEGLILHSREIASREGDFIFLNNDEIRRSFLSGISDVVSTSDFKLVASVIKKEELKSRYAEPISPYDLALIFIMEKIFRHACNTGIDYIHFITESRGRKEDDELYKAFEWFKKKDEPGTVRMFNRFIDEDMLDKIHLRLEFRRKWFNIVGNQIADLVVSPIARTVLDSKDHPSYKYFKDKFLYGRQNSLKVFP